MIKGEVFGMRAVKPVELRNNQKAILDLAYGGEIVLVARPAKKNVVVLSEDEFNKREKAFKNAEYLAKLEMSIAQAERGEVVMYTKEQMRAMAED
jgi:antitoxin YefM